MFHPNTSASDRILHPPLHNTLNPTDIVRYVCIDSRPSFSTTSHTKTDNSSRVIHPIPIQHQWPTRITRTGVLILFPPRAQLRLDKSHLQFEILFRAFFKLGFSYSHCQFNIALKICKMVINLTERLNWWWFNWIPLSVVPQPDNSNCGESMIGVVKRQIGCTKPERFCDHFRVGVSENNMYH